MRIAGFSIQSILIIHGFCTCKLTYLLKFVTQKSILIVLLWSLVDMIRVAKSLSYLTCTFPAEGETLPYFSSHARNNCSLQQSIQCYIFVIFVGNFKMAQVYCGNAIQCSFLSVPYRENILNMLHSGTSYSAVGHKFNVYEYIIYSK